MFLYQQSKQNRDRTSSTVLGPHQQSKQNRDGPYHGNNAKQNSNRYNQNNNQNRQNSQSQPFEGLSFDQNNNWNNQNSRRPRVEVI